MTTSENKKIIRISKDTELKSRLGMYLYKAHCDGKNREEFLDSLLEMNSDIERCYKRMRASQENSLTQRRYMERIHVLEDARFDLLAKISKHDMLGYNTLPLDVSIGR